MLAKWTELLPLFIVRWLALRMCERVPMRREGNDRVVAVARPDVYIKIGGQHGDATPQPTQPDPAYSEACNLATALFKKHFAHLPDYASGQAVWGLFDSTEGVILQIDNMVSGLVQPPTTSPQADSVQEDAARYRWLRRWKGQEHEPPFTVQHEIDGTLWGGDLDAAIDAARKQGANHDYT